MILYLIPARGGSKRLPNKNLRKLAGIPLVAWAIRRAQGAARLVGGESRVVVSTDSPEIARVSREWGAEVIYRSEDFCTDEATSEAVALHALAAFAGAVRTVVLVQPTSPLCPPGLVAIVARKAPENSALTREGCPTGGAYAMTAEALAAGIRFDGGEGGSGWVYDTSPRVDIDTEDDWKMAEALLAAREISPFAISGRKIGPGHPCFVIAEAGINHGGDVDTAAALIDAAAEAGADAVKFQMFSADDLAEPGPHRELLRRHELPWSAWGGLRNRALLRGLTFLCSPFDKGSVDILDSFDVPAFKIPSGEIINLPLLRHVASKGKPVILSTGMSTMREVAAAVDALSGVPLALLHCVSEYPVLRERDMNLRAIDTLRQAFGVPVGFSDHTLDYEAAAFAVARGACIVERHIRLDGYSGPDANVSFSPREFGALLGALARAEQMLGSGEKVPTPGELETAKVARRRDGLRRNP